MVIEPIKCSGYSCAATKWIHKSFVPLFHNSHLNDASYGHDSGKSRGHKFCGVTYHVRQSPVRRDYAVCQVVGGEGHLPDC